MSLTTLLFLLFLNPQQASANCNAPPSKIDNAYSRCDQMRTANLPQDIMKAMGEMQQQGFCALPDQIKSTAAPLREICADPAKFVCSTKTGLVFNSQCQLELEDSKEIGELAIYKNEECAFEQEKNAFIQKHKLECALGLSAKDCEDHIKLSYTDDILKIERLHFYTPERVARVRGYFDRVKQKYLDLINQSTLVPQDKKAYLLSRIQSTQLFLDPYADKTPECMNAGVNPPGSELYNDIGRGLIVVCLGVMANLERNNPQALIVAMAHELSHSIDPCVLEAMQLQAQNPVPNLGKESYPGLLQCLRGGMGEDGCKSSILHCNSPKGIADSIAEVKASAISNEPARFSDPKSQDQLEKDILADFNATPDCAHGKSDKNEDSLNAADFRKDPEPIEQIGESFADFMGAEITGRLAAEDAAHGNFDQKDALDALLATSTSFTQLHGGCRTENTHDEHPIGMLRINRDIMSNRSFREAMGCMNGPPMAKGAKATCRGL